MEWTKEQQKVISLRNRNILVSAAAGSGKTAVLVERIIQMISDSEHPTDIDRLVIVTFTKAAAGEMRERIGKAIEKKVEEEPDNKHLQKQLLLLHNAQITTIHSFCMFVIQNYFHRIDLDPSFRMGDDAEMQLLKSDVLSSILEERYENPTDEFMEFAGSYLFDRSDAKLEEMILSLYEFGMSYPWPIEWFDECKKEFEIVTLEEMYESEPLKKCTEYISKIMKGVYEKNKRALTLALSADGPYMYEDALVEDKNQFAALLQAKDYESISNCLSAFAWKRLSSKKDESVNPDKKEQVKALREETKKIISDLCKNFFYQSPDEMLADIKQASGSVRTIIDLVKEFTVRFQEEKEERGLIDFHDLEHLALKILVNKEETGEVVPSATAIELRDEFDEILIDEYQDSNKVQETILNSISKEKIGKPNVFMVGDVKQSIYKFRLAEPELFMHKMETYSVEESLKQRIDLSNNFRSRKIVLDSVNYIFERIMKRELGDVEYDEKAALYVGSEYAKTTENVSDSVEMIYVSKEDTPQEQIEDTDEEEIEYSERELEAKAVAAKIKEMVQSETALYVLDKDVYRPSRYSDIVILLRATKGWADIFQEVLLEEGIPAYSDTQTGYFSTTEVRTILNMLRIIDNPKQDIPLASVLRSYIGGFSDEELSLIRGNRKNVDFYTTLLEYSNYENSNSDCLEEKVIKFLSKLDDYRDRITYMSVYDLLNLLYEQTGFYYYISALPGGERRRANLDMLLQRGIDFENTSYQGLFHFIRYIEKLEKFEIDFGEASTIGENENAVRIMTIHKSKGLEFPIVFVSGMGKQFNNMDNMNWLAIHPTLFVGPEAINNQMRTKIPTLYKKIIQKVNSLENLGEELRVLYVALTRAKEKLILTGFLKKPKEDMSKYAGKELDFLGIATAKSYMDWVAPVFMQESTVEKEKPNMKQTLVTAKDLLSIEVDNQISKVINKKSIIEADLTKTYEAEVKKILENREEFVYPYAQEENLPVKLSVSEIKKKSMLEDGEMEFTEEAVIPAFMKDASETVQSGAFYGTIIHHVMACMNFETIHCLDDVKVELQRLVDKKILLSEDAAKCNPYLFYLFSKTDLCDRMTQAHKESQLFREQPFVMGVPAQEVVEGYGSDELVLIQGIIDAFFEENEELVLIDYKTDSLNEGEEEILIKRYQSQLDLYQKALEKMTGKRVKEKILYSFSLEKEIKLNEKPQAE